MKRFIHVREESRETLIDLDEVMYIYGHHMDDPKQKGIWVALKGGHGMWFDSDIDTFSAASGEIIWEAYRKYCEDRAAE